MSVVAVIDGTMGAGGAALRQARAIAAFLRDGLTGEASGQAPHGAGQTLIFYSGDGDRAGLLRLAPTRAVRLVKVAAHAPGQTAGILAARAGDDAPRGRPLLFLFAGPSGVEAAARLAGRAHGSVLTGVLSAELSRDELLARMTICSGHLIGRFALTATPWCLCLDASWDASAVALPAEHEVLPDEDATGRPGSSPLEDVEFVPLPSAGDLAASGFLVAAGQGAGSRERIERLTQAARRMGASFGVSRPVAMNAWAPMDALLGVSGARTAPEVCLVAGASGAPAFAWGIEQAAFIAAVTTDAQAPIAGDADVVLLDDAVAVIEALADIVEAHKDVP